MSTGQEIACHGDNGSLKLPIHHHFVFITDPEQGALRPLAKKLGVPALDIPVDVGGRFSVLTPVGMLPAALIGIDITEIAAGAAGVRSSNEITREDISQALADRRPYYDKAADYHYDTISAFIKSLRGSDPDASLYWLARMIESGEDPLFIIRRMVILASEDVGLADPQALSVAVACQQAVHFIGMPEGFYAMAECCLYLALAPKSNSAGASYFRAKEDAIVTSHVPVPLHLRNAATNLMKQFGYGKDYRSAHDEANHFIPEASYLPETLNRRKYYAPGTLGYEAQAAERLRRLRGEETQP